MGDLPLRDPEVYRLARELDRLRRQIHDVQVASQGAHRSVEDGAIDVYDDNDTLRERIGKQTDGTYGRKSFAGDPPPAPTDPDVQVIHDGVVAVTWDGRFEEKYLTGEFRAVQVHLGDTVDFTCTRNTMEGAIFTRWGGTMFLVTESDDDNPVYVKLRAINRAGVVGAESAGVLVDEADELNLEDEEELAWEDGDGHTLTQADVDAGTVTFPLSHTPEQESLLAWWHPGGLDYAGEDQAPSQFSIDYEARTITWPLTGAEKAGDRLRVYYAYYDIPALDIPLGHEWLYATGLGSATTYAQPGYDDSSWQQAPTPFGWGDPGVPVTWATEVPEPVDLWMRIHVETYGGDLTFIYEDVDDDAWVYLDGVEVGHVGRTSPSAGVTSGSFTVPCSAGEHVIAVYGQDAGNTDGNPQKGYIGFAIHEEGAA